MKEQGGGIVTREGGIGTSLFVAVFECERLVDQNGLTYKLNPRSKQLTTGDTIDKSNVGTTTIPAGSTRGPPYSRNVP